MPNAGARTDSAGIVIIIIQANNSVRSQLDRELHRWKARLFKYPCMRCLPFHQHLLTQLDLFTECMIEVGLKQMGAARDHSPSALGCTVGSSLASATSSNAAAGWAAWPRWEGWSDTLPPTPPTLPH